VGMMMNTCSVHLFSLSDGLILNLCDSLTDVHVHVNT